MMPDRSLFEPKELQNIVMIEQSLLRVSSSKMVLVGHLCGHCYIVKAYAHFEFLIPTCFCDWISGFQLDCVQSKHVSCVAVSVTLPPSRPFSLTGSMRQIDRFP
jgi:hypothetical protein